MKLFQFVLTAFLFISIFFFNSCKEPGPSEPEETIPQELNANTTYTNEISTVGEVHHYLYKPTTNHYIHIACTEAVQYSEFDPYISLLDYTTKHVFDEEASQTQAVITNFYVEAGKTYEGLVREYSDDRTGSYTLLIDKDNDDEKSLIIDQNINGEIDYVKDYDEFILNISEKGYYHIAVREYTTNSNVDPVISLLDFATKHLLDEEASQTEAILVNKNLGQNPSYWIKVSEYSNDNAGMYIITYMKDPDDSVTFYSSPVYYEGNINYAKDVDKFYFDPYWSDTYKIVLAEKIPNSEVDPVLRIYDEYNNLLGQSASNDSCVVNLSLDASKIYYIKASEWSDDRPGEYILKIEMQ